MATTSEVPVLIVGGGAVGCVLSMELARRGIDTAASIGCPGRAVNRGRSRCTRAPSS